MCLYFSPAMHRMQKGEKYLGLRKVSQTGISRIDINYCRKDRIIF